MNDLQKEFEATGYNSWINSDLYPNGKIYTQEYTEWLEKQVIELRSKVPSNQPHCWVKMNWILKYPEGQEPKNSICDCEFGSKTCLKLTRKNHESSKD